MGQVKSQVEQGVEAASDAIMGRTLSWRPGVTRIYDFGTFVKWPVRMTGIAMIGHNPSTLYGQLTTGSFELSVCLQEYQDDINVESEEVPGVS